ncbi:MAG: hypothetical protein N3A66_12445, partial [Planctomycetota bacterium]|nr:hypothetical protein [Planctomycetota bacterium]
MLCEPPKTDSPPLPLGRWRAALALAGIIVLALSLRLLCMRSYFVMSDTVSAWHYAQAIKEGKFAETLRGQPTHHAMRLPLNFALALAGELLPEPRQAIAAAALFFHLTEMVLLYAWGTALMERRLGLLALFIFALYPVAIVEGSQAHIHVLISCFLTAASLALYCGWRDSRRG